MKPAIFIIIMTVLLGSCATIHSFPLIDAAEKGQIERVKALLEAGADVNAKANDGRTALMWAEDSGHNEIVEILKKAEAKE